MFEEFHSRNLHGGALEWHGMAQENLEWTFYYSKLRLMFRFLSRQAQGEKG